MAGDAGLQGIVGFGNDLGKTRRARRKVLVAERAIPPVFRRGKPAASRVLDVERSRPVADLALQAPVVGLVLDRHDIVVTLGAGLVTGVLCHSRNRLVDCPRAVASVEAEIGGDQEMPHHDKADDDQGDRDGEAFDLVGDRVQNISHFGAAEPPRVNLYNLYFL